MAEPAKPEIQPDKRVFGLVFLAGVIVFAVLFTWFGFLKLPSGTAQQIAAYYGTRMVPIGVAFTLLGVAAAIAASVGAAFGKVVGGEFSAQGAAVSIGDITDLLKAAAALSSTPAGIGVLVTVLGVALLIGSGAAATATPAATA
jgi:hypothetical protein